MENKNVEYNEIRCNKLIVGDRETGFVMLSVSKEERSPALTLSLTHEDHKAGVVIGFRDGAPTLGLINENGEKKGSIAIGFGDGELPTLTFYSEDAADGKARNITLGVDDDGFPSLFLSAPSDKGRSIVNLGIDDISSYLALIGRSVDGSNIVLRSSNEEAGIILTSSDRLKAEEEILGILLISNSEGSVINIEGVEHINRTWKDKEEIKLEE